ncbi:hypothetical protein [Flavobacterium sp. A45]|jgi:hypothetical protein|uniref:hypothetical protein n=1 Tax=Flavobacterium sp. A45 TaxID=1945862 RepID=UPI0009878191|nr:hypothetical protein [Flavobacterium sp. A45]OOG73227.1 hypothetical protein B0E44_07875 [Flavobacterium sp. A45]
MKIRFLSILVIAMSLSGLTAFSQTSDTGELGLPGDNLDLYAVLDLFQKSKTIEDFEKSLNDEKNKINNLDLNDDKKIDFIKVETKKDGEDFTFILRDPISKTETQDVAVIMVSKDKNKKISLQIVGDKDLYGKDYIVEPSASGNAGVTANPAYTGTNPVTVNVPASTTTVVVEQAPIVQYVYSPAYVPYYPPYYYGYYPPWFGFATVMAVGIYRSNHYHYHGGGYGYHNTNVYVNHNSFNNYNNNSRNTSNRISHNNINSNNRNNINNGNRNSASTRESGRNSATTRDGNKASASTRDKSKASASNRSSSSRPSASNSMSSRSSNSSLNRGSSGGGYRSGGGGGGYRGGGGFSGGGGRRR